MTLDQIETTALLSGWWWGRFGAGGTIWSMTDGVTDYWFRNITLTICESEFGDYVRRADRPPPDAKRKALLEYWWGKHEHG